MTDDLDPLLDGPTPLPRHRADRSYAISLAITVALVVGLIVWVFSQANHGRDRAERNADEQTEIAGLLRSQLAVALEQLDTDRAVTDCIRALTTKLNEASVNQTVAFNTLLIGVTTRASDITELRTNWDTSVVDLAAALAAYVARICPAPSG